MNELLIILFPAVHSFTHFVCCCLSQIPLVVKGQFPDFLVQHLTNCSRNEIKRIRIKFKDSKQSEEFSLQVLKKQLLLSREILYEIEILKIFTPKVPDWDDPQLVQLINPNITLAELNREVEISFEEQKWKSLQSRR
jgi:hypothetical protein